MNHVELMDRVLEELTYTRQPAISIRRIFKKYHVDFDDELIRSIESTLNAKSLVIERGKDSAGYACFSLTQTGRDFVKTYESYSKYVKGLEEEQKSVKRAKKKKPYVANKLRPGEAPTPYTLPEKSFLEKNGAGILILLILSMLFYVAAEMTN